MAFTLREATCTAVGSFNIYIFRPDWIAGLFPGGDASEVEQRPLPQHDLSVDLTQPGLRLRFPGWRTEWTVRPDRLIVATIPRDASAGEREEQAAANDPADCGSAVATVLETLRETPLREVGNTFRFVAPADEPVPNLPAGHLFAGWPNPPDVETVRSSGFGCVLDGPGGSRVSFSLTRTGRAHDLPGDLPPGGLLAMVNVRENASRVETCAGRAADFRNDYELAQALIRTHLRSEVAA